VVALSAARAGAVVLSPDRRAAATHAAAGADDELLS
jgi:hypothetical protein